MLRRSVGRSALVLVVMLGVVAWRNLEMLNSDAVAYLRIASYYAQGQSDLAISGYWGPLLSWLLAPLLKVGVKPLIAARLVMAVSAVIFWVGCLAVFRSFQLPSTMSALGSWLAVLAAVGWSVRFITPDLLASGLICLATSQMVHAHWRAEWVSPALSGVLWGLAYLAKAIALPLAFAVCFGLILIEQHTTPSDPRRRSRAALVTLFALVLVVSPWVLVLSLKYRTLTFSTTAAIAHAVAGPQDMNRQHPVAIQFHRPDPGRVTSWEDPSLMPYQYWSPFASRAYAAHQLKITAKNVLTIAAMLSRMNLLAPILVLFLAYALSHRQNRMRLAGNLWLLAVVPVGALVLLYLPFFINWADQRYFYAAFPFMWVISVGLLSWLGPRYVKEASRAEKLFSKLAFSGFALPALVLVGAALIGLPRFAPACTVARELATKLDAAGIRGSIAGSALMRGGRAGLYTAFFLNRPWYGDEAHPTAASFKASGARLIVVKRDDPVTGQLDTDSRFHSLDKQLFGSAEEAARFPLTVYELAFR